MSHFVTHVERQVLEDGTVRWEAWHPTLPLGRVSGLTPTEAQEVLEDARRAYLQALRDCGQPEPASDTGMPRAVIFVH